MKEPIGFIGLGIMGEADGPQPVQGWLPTRRA